MAGYIKLIPVLKREVEYNNIFYHSHLIGDINYVTFLFVTNWASSDRGLVPSHYQYMYGQAANIISHLG